MDLILLKKIDKTNKSFEDIKHIEENGVEFWYARELMPILQYLSTPKKSLKQLEKERKKV